MSTTTTTPAAVLRLLIDEPRPWTVEELARAMGDRLATVDALAELAGSGLVHRIPPAFVMASRPAIHAARLDLGGDE